MKYLIALFFSLLTIQSFCQEKEGQTLYETANSFIKEGDYANAVLVLNRALQQEPNNLELQKTLAFVQYLQGNYTTALATVKPLVDRKDADVATFQVAGMIFKGKQDAGESEKLYKKALKKFPNSGVLYSEYGELLWSLKNYDAIKQWEKGIDVDPNYPGNYYFAARYYYFTMDKSWSIIYGEIFVNMESYSRRTVEIKSILLNSYKKLFTDEDIMKNQQTNDEFAVAFLNTIAKQSSLTSMGITAEALTMIRTRFLLDWDEKYASRFPSRLFDYHRQLLREGMFEAYNQWLFGSVQNLTAFQSWINTHSDNYAAFTSFQQGRVFRIAGGPNAQKK